MVRDMLIFCLGWGWAQPSPAQRTPANSRNKKIHGFYSMLSAQASSGEDSDIHFITYRNYISIHVVSITYNYYLRRIFTNPNVAGLSYVWLSLQFNFHVLSKSLHATIDIGSWYVPLENAWTEICITDNFPQTLISSKIGCLDTLHIQLTPFTSKCSYRDLLT